ncbi:alpha-L-rhamnosidase [Polluticaenibacter yanchengensis]|uniref:alpha-L-rhamnosidase n=1 Tax=Polluticaenibacter yanchengensis TaxID=3014562 RepID=A0ABT4UFL1_9BACT|nr:family 78 glycoside hydrolase catalytic domain [Chitinophagaceae bacterium LY-5]
MKQLIIKTILALGLVVNVAYAQLSVKNLRVEMLNNPEGIDVVNPRLSWQSASQTRGDFQKSYRVIVASTQEKLDKNIGDLWDTETINSSQSIHVYYAGKPLKGKTNAYWKVQVTSYSGQTSWSATGTWSMGILHYVDWKGRWIGLDELMPWDIQALHARLSARYFRKEFEAKKTIKQAKAYIMGLGLYELHINGEKVGNHVLAPSPTDYDENVKYNTFDVTRQLQNGKNAVGIVLGNGRFYAMRQVAKPYKVKTFGFPKALLNIEILYTDGSKEVIATDDSWKVTADGPIRANNEYDGEEYDATKELTGWNKIGYNDATWRKPEQVQNANGNYEAQMNEPMVIKDSVFVKTITRLRGDTFILDMGQNMVGWLQLKQLKGTRGQTVKLRFAETLQKDGSLYTANLRDAHVTDLYTLKGDANGEQWEPSFIYHGFRYVEITNFPGTPVKEQFVGKVVYDDLDNIGSVATSNNTLNRIFKNAWWGISGNYKGMPVDCPQRNERQPWLGDRTIGAYGESFLFDNAKLYAKWIDDIGYAQRADGSIPDVAPIFWRYFGDNVTWPGTYITVTDMLYRQFGDTKTLTAHYPKMKLWMNYMHGKYLNNEGLITKDKYGDWCVPPESLEMIHSQDPKRKTDGMLIASGNFCHMLNLMSDFAKVLGYENDIKDFQQKRDAIKTAFNKRFYNAEKGYYDNNTVTANILPLMFGLVEEENKSTLMLNVADKILNENKGHISTGVIGTQWLMRSLSQNGYENIAYKIASNTTYPSWGYMAENGATTIWELWNGNTADPKMNSGNHVMLLGDLLIWYFEHLAGIKNDESGVAFKKITMKPTFTEGLETTSGNYKSPYGEIKSAWLNQKKLFTWDITVPFNSEATVYLPTTNIKAIKEGKKPLVENNGYKIIGKANGQTILSVGSGTYSFTISK